MGRLTRALLITGGLYVAYYLGEIAGYVKGAKVIIEGYAEKEKKEEDNEKKKEEAFENIRIDRLESGVDIASSNLDILRSRTEDLEERIKILDSAFNYHIMDEVKHGGN